MALQLEDMDQPPSYNNPPPPGYTEPNQPAYAQPNQPGYGHPNQPGYGPPPPPGQPGYGGYSQPGYGPYPPNQPMYPQGQQQQQQVVVVGGGGHQQTIVPIVHINPPNYLALAIITTMCCNPLCGIIAIIFSCLSTSAADDGQFETARSRGKISCSFSIIGIIVAILATVAIIVYIVVIVNTEM